jgi:hypothetical protein
MGERVDPLRSERNLGFQVVLVNDQEEQAQISKGVAQSFERHLWKTAACYCACHCSGNKGKWRIGKRGSSTNLGASTTISRMRRVQSISQTPYAILARLRRVEVLFLR